MARMNTNRIFNFGIDKINALPVPEKGKRAVYRDKKVKHLFLRVTPTSKTFYFQRTIDNRKVTINIDQFPTVNVKTARDRVDEINADYVKGVDVELEMKEKRDELTLGELWEDYKIHRKKARRDPVTGKIKPSVANEYNYNRHYKQWENSPLSHLTYARMRGMIIEIWERGAIPHGNRVYNLGTAMFKHAIGEMNWRGRNPFSFSKKSEADRKRTEKRLYRADMPAFMAAMDKLQPAMKLVILAALFTGRRIGECRAMRWVDLDLESELWTIPREINKIDKEQTVALGEYLTKLLVEWKQEKQSYRAGSKWVFPSWGKTGHIMNTTHAWNSVRKFGFQHLNLNDLRGTMNSWAQEIGAYTLAQAGQQLGHDSLETTKRNYTHLDPATQLEGLNKTVEDMLVAASDKEK